MAETRKIEIAVSGGGLAGAAIARALYQQPHIQVNVYESAPEFLEKGMAIVVAINAQRALAKLVPDVEEMFKRAGAVTVNSSRIMLVSCYFYLSKTLFIIERQRRRGG
jgi:salicylate hydroxylase